MSRSNPRPHSRLSVVLPARPDCPPAREGLQTVVSFTVWTMSGLYHDCTIVACVDHLPPGPINSAQGNERAVIIMPNCNKFLSSSHASLDLPHPATVRQTIPRGRKLHLICCEVSKDGEENAKTHVHLQCISGAHNSSLALPHPAVDDGVQTPAWHTPPPRHHMPRARLTAEAANVRKRT